MSKENNGGPAFPVDGSKHHLPAEGMSLRDYFAAEAAAALPPPTDYCGVQETADSYAKWARKAYRMADALLKARG